MGKCSQCDAEVLIGIYGKDLTVVLDATARCFAALSDAQALVPTNGMRLFQADAYVEHRAVCPGKRPTQQRPRRKELQGRAVRTTDPTTAERESSTDAEPTPTSKVYT